jgi:hypothetical protein
MGWYVASRAVHIDQRDLAARAIGEMLDGALSDDVDDIARLIEDCQANNMPEIAQMLFDGLPEKLRRTKRIQSAFAR